MQVRFKRGYKGNYLWVSDYGWGPFKVVGETTRCYRVMLVGRWYSSTVALLKERFEIDSPSPKMFSYEEML